VSNDEITVFCSGDSIVSFTACFAVGFSSLQPASSINRSTAALVIWVHLRDLIDSRCSKLEGPTGRSVCEAESAKEDTGVVQVKQPRGEEVTTRF
jgi:hypothetical protein